MLFRQETPLVESSNPMEDAAASRGHRRSASMASIFCGCCFGSEDSGVDKSLLRPSWFQKVRRSTSGPDAGDSESQNWLRKGWNSVRRAGEWSESLVDDYSGGCCSGPKWRQFARRFKADGKSIYKSRPARFQYDAMSYELNFDDGLRPDGEFQQPYNQGLAARMGSPEGKARESSGKN